jgi:ABC-type siderophore export system fused ATPase/permease subunit
MRLNQPKKITWWISVILLVIGLVLHFVTSLGFGDYAIWFATASAVLLILATALKGL